MSSRRDMNWMRDVNWLEAFSLFGLGIVVYFLWSTPVVYPLKILVVFFHEISHGIAALATGGRIVEIRVNAFQGGLCLTQGGNSFTILSAGYLGSLIWGGTILLWAANAKSHGRITMGLGALLIAVTIIFVRPAASFGFGFGLVAGIGLIAVGLHLTNTVNQVLLKAIGLTSCMYAILDIKSDVLTRPESRSDAAMLADLTGIPTMVWGILWIIIALPTSFYFVAAACRRTPPRRPRSPAR